MLWGHVAGGWRGHRAQRTDRPNERRLLQELHDRGYEGAVICHFCALHFCLYGESKNVAVQNDSAALVVAGNIGDAFNINLHKQDMNWSLTQD